MGWEIAVVLVLVLVNGVFAMSELALVSARRSRLRRMAADGSRGAAAALDLMADTTRFLSTVQIGITSVAILAGVYSGTTIAHSLADLFVEQGLRPETARPLAIGLVVALVTFLSLVVGELVPKRIGLSHSERIAALVARPMSLMARTGAPLVWVLQRSTEGLLRLLRSGSPPTGSVTEEEVRTLIAEAAEAGVFQTGQHEMIEGVLHLAERTVESVMTPASAAVWIRTDDDAETVRAKMAESGRSRFPVGDSMPGGLRGVVLAKDLFRHVMQAGRLDISESLRPPLVVGRRLSLLRLVEIFRETPVHLAVIVDEHGGTLGIVTPTDVLTAIAGDLPDDADAAPPERGDQ